MRHRKKSEKFSRPRGQRKALVKALIRSLIINERIKTTTSKAKYLRSEVDRLITLAKSGSLWDKRLAYRKLQDHRLVKKLFEDIGPRFKNVAGGYTRVLMTIPREGDGAQMAICELTKLAKIKKKKTRAKSDKRVELEESEIKEKTTRKKEDKSQKGIISGVKKIFKKDKKNPK